MYPKRIYEAATSTCHDLKKNMKVILEVLRIVMMLKDTL